MSPPAFGIPFERPYFLHYYDCDWRRRQTIFSALRFFEDIATLQSEQRGIGLDYYESAGVGWVLMHYDIVIHDLANFGSTVLVRTQPQSFRSMLATRSFAILDEMGETCVEALSHWMYVDTARRRPLRIPQEMFNGYGIMEESPDLALPAAPPAPEQVMDEREFSVRMTDIDTNGHVNNNRYVEWALEALPEQLRREGQLTALRVQFRKETRYGGSVVARSAWEEQAGGVITARHAISAQGTDVCLLSSEWQLP